VSEELAKRAGLAKVKTESRLTAQGTVEYDVVQADRLSVGTTALTSPQVGVLTSRAVGQEGGILGLDALVQRVCFIDAPGKRFYAGLKGKKPEEAGPAAALPPP
jgi:hypothetical protein